ncbi:sugar-binding protein [Bacteroidota bacterium]
MKRFYLYSIIIHMLLFLWLYSTDFFGLAKPEPPEQQEKEITKEMKKEEENKFKELIKKQIEEKKQRIKQVKELIEKYKPELTEKQIENFSDVITSSDLDEEKINEMTENYFGDGDNGLSGMQNELKDYLKSNGSGKIEGESGEQSGNKNGTGNEEENLQLDMTYEGSEIDNTMPDHTVQSEENKELLNRKLERLKVEEAINVVDDVETLYPNFSQKQAKYAILPELPVESLDTFERTQETEFKSLRKGLAPRMNREFVPDGKLDEWELTQPMTSINDDADPEFTAKVYLAWDFDEIFLAAEVTDPYPIREDAGVWWTTNSLEVWFDALNRKMLNNFDSGCFQFWFAPYPPYFGKALGRHSLFARATPFYVQKTDKGYIVEAVFKTDEELRYVEGLLGRVIGFHFFVNTSIKDYDGYEKRLFWITDKYLPRNVHTYTWTNPNSWGDVLLMGSSAEIYLTDKNYTEVYEHFGINELNRVVIQDADRNLDPDTRQYVKGFLRGKISGDMEEVLFAETENDSYKFVAVILSESSLAKQNDGILQTQSGEPIEIIYYDQYTPDGISQLIKKEIYTYYPVAVFSGKE